ncbi:hypothetical protein CSPX01_08496 [Colletotrichum filicis]|nr:hypothetical protein CSPX01_08496 [Colletotrichum filicis]
MKALSTLLIVAAIINHVSAAPTADPRNLVSESSLEAEYHTSWLEDPTVGNPHPDSRLHEIKRRSWLTHDSNHGFEKEREDKGTVVILAEAIV